MPNYIDQSIGHKLWTEQDVSLYNKLDLYLAKKMVKQMPVWETYGKLLRPRKWTPNMGPVMKGVSKEPAPVLRQSIYPNTIQQSPKKDIVELKENAQSSQLHWHRIESQLFNVVPSFQDFLKDHIDSASSDITQKLMITADQFYRTWIFECAPEIWVCGNTDGGTELESVDHMNNSDTALTNRKTSAVMAALIAKVGGPLTLNQMHKISTVMSVDLNVNPYEGGFGAETNKGLAGKYCAILSGEVWDNWQHDPFLLANRQINLDIVTGRFMGSLWGRWTTMLERYPLRFAADGSQPAPEIIEMNTDSPEYGEVKVNPDYKNAPYEVAWACGDGGYERIEVGPPPSAFAKGDAGVSKLRSMNWNGEVRLTKDVLVNVPNEASAVVQDTNKYGHYCQLISELVLGCLPTRRRAWIPVLFKRARLGNEISA